MSWIGAWARRWRWRGGLGTYRRGATVYRSGTTVRDPRQLLRRQIAGLDQQRWDSERAVDLAKTHLGRRLVWSIARPAMPSAAARPGPRPPHHRTAHRPVKAPE